MTLVGVLLLDHLRHLLLQLLHDGRHARRLQPHLQHAAPVRDLRVQCYASRPRDSPTMHATGGEEVGEGRVVLLDRLVLHDQLVDEGEDFGRGEATCEAEHAAHTSGW